MNNKFCPNCGAELIEESVFCTNCGVKLSQDNNVIEENNTQTEVVNEQPVSAQPVVQSNTTDTINYQNSKSNATLFGVLSLVLYFAGSVIISLLSYFLPADSRDAFMSLSGLCPLAGIVLMIMGRVKYPTSKFLKVVMWIIIGSIILSIIAFILLFIWCYITCSNMDTSGCG